MTTPSLISSRRSPRPKRIAVLSIHTSPSTSRAPATPAG